MRRSLTLFYLLHACFYLFSGNFVHGLEYDYSATTECLEEPWSAHYGGGILADSGFDKETEGWATYEKGNIKVGSTKGGNKFVVAFNRELPTDSLSRRVELEEGKIYAFSGWVQVNEGNATISVVFASPSGEMVYGGGVMAQHGCWKLLKGGIVSNFSGLAHIILKSNNKEVEIWASNIALQPFTQHEWRSHQDQTIQKVRKGVVNFHTSYTNKTQVTGSKITLKLTKPHFPVGCVINAKILTNPSYQNWISSRFTVVTFENEMKWYDTENVQGKEDYSLADAMMKFADQHRIAVRGHNILWDDPKYQPYWVKNLSPQQLQTAVQRRINSVVTRYKGRVIHWDVINENVHFGFFESKLGNDVSAKTFGLVHQLDPGVTVFMNDYNTIEVSQDQDASPQKYLSKLKSILAYSGNNGLPAGIGLESRFAVGQPNLAYMRAGMDYLAASKYPLWLTEVFVDSQQNQEQFLEQVFREGYAHPAVKGIVTWPNSPLQDECKMCFTDANFKNTPTGNVIDKLIKEWGSKNSEITFECNGSCSASLPHGDYEGFILDYETNLKRPLNVVVKEDNVKNNVHVEFAS